MRTTEPRNAPPRRGRRTAALAAFVLVVTCALPACQVVQPPAPVPSPTAAIAVTPGVMNGVTTAVVQVTADGAWSLTSDRPAWVSLQPASGNGNATVDLTVDPSGLAPTSYAIGLTLTDSGGSVSASLPFSFPDVTVTVTRGDTLSSQALASQASTARAVDPRLHTFPAGPADLIVGVGKVPSQAAELPLAALRQVAGVEVRSAFAAAGVVTVHVRDATAAADRLARLPGVRYVEAALPLDALSNDTYRSQQWNLDVIGAEPSWPSGDGTGATVAVLDRGFDPAHPDLSSGIVGTYDAVSGGSDVTVTNTACGSHGTHVAGIVAATAGNALGVAGVAPGAGLLLVNLGDPTDAGCAMTTPALIAGLGHVTHGGAPLARVVNMSLGASGPLGQGVEDALAAAQAAGIVLVAASGNDTTTQPTPVVYPAAYPEVLAVGATTRTDDIAYYSDRGPEVFVSAPGGGTAVDAGSFATDWVLSTWLDLNQTPPTHVYAYDLGTSMASPAVAGLAAQLLTLRPGASVDQVAGALADGAVDLGTPGRDDLFGYGRVDALASKSALASGTPLILKTGDGRSFAVVRDVPFTVPNVAAGTVILVAGTDDGGNGTLGDAPGELLGSAQVAVAFDAPPPAATVTLTPQ